MGPPSPASRRIATSSTPCCRTRRPPRMSRKRVNFLLPPPCGEGWGGGRGDHNAFTLARHLSTPTPPSPTPPHKGEGKHAETHLNQAATTPDTIEVPLQPAVGDVPPQSDALAVSRAHDRRPHRRLDRYHRLLAHAVEARRRASAAVACRRSHAYPRLVMGCDFGGKLGAGSIRCARSACRKARRAISSITCASGSTTPAPHRSRKRRGANAPAPRQRGRGTTRSVVEGARRGRRRRHFRMILAATPAFTCSGNERRQPDAPSTAQERGPPPPRSRGRIKR